MMLSQLNSLHPRVEQIRRDGFGMWNERNHDFFNAKICVANGMERKQENTSTVVALTPEDYVTNICTSFNERNNRTLVSNSLHPCMCAPEGLERRPKQQGAAET